MLPIAWAFAVGLTAFALAGCRSSDEPIGQPAGTPSPAEVWAQSDPRAYGADSHIAQLGDEYIEQYFATFPTRATAAGLTERDLQLEDFSRERLDHWFEVATSIRGQIAPAIAADCAPTAVDEHCTAARIDGELLRREIDLHLLDWQERALPRHDPTVWSSLASQSTVYFLVRTDVPLEHRLAATMARLGALPGFLRQAQEQLAGGRLGEIAPLHCRLAASQARSLADFYRTRLTEALSPPSSATAPTGQELDSIRTAAADAARALDEFAAFSEELAARATGTPVLGASMYARRFALYTGLEETPAEILQEAEAALTEQIAEADRHVRSFWDQVLDEPQPSSARERVRRMFARVGDDRAASIPEFVQDYRTLVRAAEAFVKEHEVVSVPDPLTLITDRSPAYFAGAAVGGVYSPGPFRPDAPTLLFLPTPPASFDAQKTDEFFRDFNHHFNVMITPHELMPGHYLQLKWAALHPSRVRALFGDPVTIEGWGTFAERLLLDLGWGDDLAYTAHLKKRMENTARTIVDIRVHTLGMTDEQVQRFVVEDALQEAQFARNMRRRTLTTSPQLVTYFLGNREIEAAYESHKVRVGDNEVRTFTDRVMTIGPVPLHWWNELDL